MSFLQKVSLGPLYGRFALTYTTMAIPSLFQSATWTPVTLPSNQEHSTLSSQTHAPSLPCLAAISPPPLSSTFYTSISQSNSHGLPPPLNWITIDAKVCRAATCTPPSSCCTEGGSSHSSPSSTSMASSPSWTRVFWCRLDTQMVFWESDSAVETSRECRTKLANSILIPIVSKFSL